MPFFMRHFHPSDDKSYRNMPPFCESPALLSLPKSSPSFFKCASTLTMALMVAINFWVKFVYLLKVVVKLVRADDSEFGSNTLWCNLISEKS